MQTHKLQDFERGWIYGAFEPTLRFSRDTEVGVLNFAAGFTPPDHIHHMASEWNLVLTGLMLVNGEVMADNDIFSFEAGERISVTFLEDTVLLCIKSPSIAGDKYEV